MCVCICTTPFGEGTFYVCSLHTFGRILCVCICTPFGVPSTCVGFSLNQNAKKGRR